MIVELHSRPGQPRRVLGFDLGTTTGWAVLDADIHGTTRVVASGTLTAALGSHPGQRYDDAYQAMASLVRRYHPLCVAVEHVARVQLSVASAAVYHGLRAMLAVVALQSDLAILEVAVSVVKKRATGSGAAKKEHMIQAATLVLGRPPATHDEADAVYVALCGCDQAAAWEPA